MSILILFVLCGDGFAFAAEVANLYPQPVIRYGETDLTSTLSLGLHGQSARLNFSLPKTLFYFFYAGGVFNTVANFNLDYAIYALPQGVTKGSDWVNTGYVKSCFPYQLGETFVRLDMAWHKLFGEKAYKLAIDNLAVKIREKYNRDHPKSQIQKVAIYMMWWPRSEKSYMDMRYPSKTHWLLLSAEK
ncbi:MAG: hypothetical protein K2X81_09960 [Candidatus Obscuribacterales bacterium]|nr:hypothetical protein [Candidatus Obscuribacterales bacterium]